VSRHDYIYISKELFKGVSGLQDQDIIDIEGLEFQTKDLEREFLEYFIDSDRQLYYEDFYYELVDATDEGLFSKQLRKV